MKKTFFTTLLILITTKVFGQSALITPKDKIDHTLPVPFELLISKPSSEYEVTINIGSEKAIYIIKEGNVPVHVISSRLIPSDKLIEATITYSDGVVESHEARLKLDQIRSPAIKNMSEIKSFGRRTFVMEPRGTESLIKVQQGKATFVVLSHVSRESWIENVTLELSNAIEKSKISIKGSPYWYEPLMVLEGSFDSGIISDTVKLYPH